MLNNVKIPPFVGALGPWPQRAIILVALAAFGFLVVLLPWHIVTRSNSLPVGHPGGRKPRERQVEAFLWPLITSATIMSRGLTISSLPCTRAKS